MAALAELLSYLPDNHLADPSRGRADRPTRPIASASPDRRSSRTGRPRPTTCATVVADVCDDGSLLEVRAGYAPNLVTAYARIDGRPVGIVANQP